MSTESEKTEITHKPENDEAEESVKNYTTVFNKIVTIPENCSFPYITFLPRVAQKISLIEMSRVPKDEQDFQLINQMIIDSLNVDENGDINPCVLTPIDALKTDSSSLIVVDDAFDGYIKASEYLANGSGLDSILHILVNELAMLISFKAHGYEIDGNFNEQLYYNIKDKTFRFICLPDSPSKQTETNSGKMDKAVAAHLMFVLIGAYPKGDDVLVNLEAGTAFEDEAASARWAALPLELKNTFISSFKGSVELEDWKKLLSRIEGELCECAVCSRKTFGDIDNCFFCGSSLDQGNLSVQLRVEDNEGKNVYSIIFGRGTVMYGCAFSPLLPAEPFMKIMYSPTRKILYIKSLTDIMWRISIGDNDVFLIKERAVPIVPGMKIKFKIHNSPQILIEKFVEPQQSDNG